MRPLHLGLLVVGAALAGGLAVKMTQPLPLPAVSKVTAPRVPAVVSKPAPATALPPEVSPQPAKPSPLVAPEPIVTEDVPRKTAIRKNEPNPAPVRIAPVQVAKTFRPSVPYTPKPFEPTAIEPTAPGKPATDPPSIVASVAPVPPATPPRHVTLKGGTAVIIRVNDGLSSDRSAGGDSFSGSLADPLVVDGLVIAERGAPVSGQVLNAHRGGPSIGTSLLELDLRTITTSDGQHVPVSTEPRIFRGDTFASDAARIGGGAAVGAIIGGMAAGTKGAAIGAGVGGVAGAGSVAANRGRPVTVPSETIIRFRLASAVTLTERR